MLNRAGKFEMDEKIFFCPGIIAKKKKKVNKVNGF
jgi:hypothetical protein